MGLDVVPPVPPAEEEALVEALARVGLALNGQPSVYGSAWRRAGLAEATGEASEELDGYAPSPRSTRGATRA